MRTPGDRGVASSLGAAEVTVSLEEAREACEVNNRCGRQQSSFNHRASASRNSCGAHSGSPKSPGKDLNPAPSVGCN